MSGFRHVLFPVDFSANCDVIRPFVVWMSRWAGAKLTLLHVRHSGVDSDKTIVARLDAFLTAHVQSLPIGNAVVEGDPADAIVHYARTHNVDLIMMPTRGLGSFRRLLIGSVTAKVLHDAPCAVWTSAHSEYPKRPDRPDVASIICAVDLNPDSANLIRRANELAGIFSARLRLVHSTRHTALRPEPYADMDFRHFILQASRDALAKLQMGAGTELGVDVGEGSIASVISEIAKQVSADLVIVGRGRLRIAYEIICSSPCPVLSL